MPEALTGLGIHLPSLVLYIVNFLVLWGVLYLVAYRPFARRLRERAQEEESRLAEEEEIRRLRQEAAEARDSALSEARKERAALLRAAEELGEEYVQDGMRRARKAGQAQLKRARDQLRLETTRANQELHGAFVELVLAAAARALGRALDEKEQQHLFLEATQELSRLKWEPPATKPIGYAIVTTAVPMTDDQKDRISDFLIRTTRRDVRSIYRVDASVVGGIAIRTGDALLDATIGGRLDRLRHHLLSQKVTYEP